MCRTADEATPRVEGVVDGGVDGGEAPSRLRRFEALHLALTPSDSPARILHSIVRAKTLLMTARKWGVRNAEP